MADSRREIETPHGVARVRVDGDGQGAGSLILGHGAGGGLEAPDLVAAATAARTAGLCVIGVEQPYRVAGRRSPAPAHQLDAAWLAVIERLRATADLAGRLVVGGRSSGARVACRTAAEAGAEAVLCLAFPVHPPGRGDDPAKSRQGELDAVEVPVLVIQGDRDPFGMPAAGPGRRIVTQPGNHALKGDLQGIEREVGAWLADVVPGPATSARRRSS